MAGIALANHRLAPDAGGDRSARPPDRGCGVQYAIVRAGNWSAGKLMTSASVSCRAVQMDCTVPNVGRRRRASRSLRPGSVSVCPAKGRPTSGCESHPGKPPEEPGSQPPTSGEIRAAKRGEAKLQAVASVSEFCLQVATGRTG